MLGPGRYLLGVVEILLLVGFAWLGAASVRRRFVAGLDGISAHLATSVIALHCCSGSRSCWAASTFSSQFHTWLWWPLWDRVSGCVWGEGGGVPPTQRRPLFRPGGVRGQRRPHQAKNPASRREPPTLHLSPLWLPS